MATIIRTPSLSGWIALQFARIRNVLKPRYTAREMVAVVGVSGNPVGA